MRSASVVAHWLAILVLVVLVGVAATGALCAADDWTFWMRYLQRIPATFRLPGASTSAAVPPERAVIRGPPGGGRSFTACAVDPYGGALQEADAWLAAHHTDAFLVWREGCLIHEHYWRGDAATRRPAGPMAKTLVALVVGRALREGYLGSLDDPVSNQIVEWQADERRRIRYRDLLGMHSGLSWYYQTRSPWGDFQRILYSSDYPRYVIRLPLVAPPGRDYDYSAWTYDLLGIALQRAGRAKYEDLASALISRPLGLDDEYLYVDRPGGTVHANCCLWTTARDWIRLGALVVAEARRPELLPPGYVAAMRIARDDKPNYGLGVFLGSPYTAYRTVAGVKSGRPTPVVSRSFQSEPFVADDVLIFEGVEDSKVWVVPSYGLVIVRMGHRAESWDDAFVPNQIMRSMRRDDARTSADTHQH